MQTLSVHEDISIAQTLQQDFYLPPIISKQRKKKFSPVPGNGYALKMGWGLFRFAILFAWL